MNTQTAQDGTGPELQSLLILPTIQLTGSSTGVPLIVDETGTSPLEEVSIQLNRPIEVVQRAVAGASHGSPPLVPITTDMIDAFPVDQLHAYQPNTFFDFTSDGVSFNNLMFGDTADGAYTIIGMTLTDADGNSSSYTAGDLATLGVQTSFTVLADHTAPTITTLALPTVTPVLGDPHYNGGALVLVHLGAADPSGQNEVTGTIHLVAPDGSTIDVAVPDADQYPNAPVGFASGDVGDAILVASEAGTYRVSGVDTSDTSGNTTHYTADVLAGLGLPTSFTVVEQGDPATVPPTGFFALDASGSGGVVQLNGNIADYTLSRGNTDFFSTDSPFDGVGDFILTASNGSGAYAIGESVDTIRFQDGQYLALRDLPAYISGSDALSIGGDQDDLIYQSRASGYEAFSGGNGDDQLFLKGNVSDYTVRAADAAFFGNDIGVQGIELISRNGSGALFIDSSVETVHFQNGQYLAYHDIGSYVAAATPDPADRLYLVAPDGLNGGSDAIDAGGFSNADDVVLLDANASDFTLSRSLNGAFVLASAARSVSIDQAVDAVQFGNGQFLSIHDLPAYIHGDATFTTGTNGDDLLYVSLSGDQYVSGGAGIDNLYIDGNTHDYSLQSVDITATAARPAIHGYELVASNGSGNIYIDQSTEVVHFQDGQYLAFQDIPAYVHGSDLIG